MEIQGQTASMLAGGLAGLMIDRVPLWLILLIDSSTYLFSFFVQSTLPYEATHVKTGAPAVNAWRAMAEGWRWLHERARLSIFFGCTLVPFILVMVSNYLFPVYVSGVLRAPAAVFGHGEIGFAIGALLAGVFIPKLATDRGAGQVITATMLVCLAALALLVVWQTPGSYYLALGLFGLGNAGGRVARNAVMLHVVPNAVMGRVGMFFNAADRLLRTVLTTICTVLVAHSGATPGFAVLWLVLLVAFAGVLATRSAVRDAGAAAAPAG
jgi:MFS-type transporter involved in bile tolerance (Atg22 family)